MRVLPAFLLACLCTWAAYGAVPGDGAGSDAGAQGEAGTGPDGGGLGDDGASLQVIAGIIVLGILVLGFALYYSIFNRKADEMVAGMGEVKPAVKFREGLDSEEKRVLEILKGSGGMRTQKELREMMGCTGSRMGRLASSLEARGLVKRIKRGREKIVKLKEA
jgi:hypothetical protein